jgi:hypothetical protein
MHKRSLHLVVLLLAVCVFIAATAQATVTTPDNRWSYAGTGFQTSFPYLSKIFADSDLVVHVRTAAGLDLLQVLNVDYTVTGALNPAGGNVVFGSAPASGQTVIIRIVLPSTQNLTLPEAGPLPSAPLEAALDRQVKITQQLQEQLNRSVHLPVGATAGAQLPEPAPNNVIGWDSLGQNLTQFPATPVATEITGISQYGDSLAQAVSEIGAASKCLLINKAVTMSAHLSVPANIQLWVTREGRITVNNCTLTINGSLEAGLYQIFACTGTGKVLFSQGSTPHVCPEWWYSGSGSWHTALNAAYKAFDGTKNLAPGGAVTWGYVSIRLSQMYTVTNSPWTMDDLRTGQIIGVGRSISGIYQSGTGNAINMDMGVGSLDASWPHLTLGHFSVWGNATSGCGIETDSACLVFYDMDINYHGSHGFYAPTNGWQMTFRDVFADYNGGDGFRFAHVGDALQFIGGGANFNTGIGINVAATSLVKAANIMQANINYNAGGGVYLWYGQYRVDSCYFEGNEGKQLNSWDLNGGFITNNNFNGGTLTPPTHAIYLNSDATGNATRNVTVSGNLFEGNTINIWQSGSAAYCLLGPNHVIDGTDEIYGTNISINSTGVITAPEVVVTSFTAVPTKIQTKPFAAGYDVNLALGAYVKTTDIGAATEVWVGAPTNPTAGQMVTLDWTNGANALTINWNAAYKTTYTSLTANKRVILQFLYDGTNYLQVGAPVELTP